jgi:hypothetical protein
VRRSSGDCQNTANIRREVKMKIRYLLSSLLTPLFGLVTFFPSVHAQDATPASQIAEHAVCRGLLAANGTAQVVCFLAFVDGVSGSLFSGAPSEATAYLTLRTDTITAQPMVNGNVVALLQSAGAYSVYFNSSPHGDWNNPDSFSSGQLVATFTRTPPILISVGTMASGFFSAKLTSSQQFVLNAQTVDFKKLVPNGVTWLLTAAGSPVATSAPGFVAAQPFAGSALAIGSKRSAHDSD